MGLLNKILSFLGLSTKSNSAVTSRPEVSNGQADFLQKVREQRAGAFPKFSDWKVDVLHSNIKFRVMHMGIAEVSGSFRDWRIDFKGSSPDFSDMKVSSVIHVNSIQTDMPARDEHLKSPDFFEAAKYPTIEFRSTSVQWRPLRFFLIEGDLTIKGVTKAAKFEGKLMNFLPKDMFDQPRVGFYLSTEINRQEYNLSWQVELASNDKAVDDIIKIEMNIEITTPQSLEALHNFVKQMPGGELLVTA